MFVIRIHTLANKQINREKDKEKQEEHRTDAYRQLLWDNIQDELDVSDLHYT